MPFETANELQGFNDAIENTVEYIEALNYVVDVNKASSADNVECVFAVELPGGGGWYR
jgi:hypothetical protein